MPPSAPPTPRGAHSHAPSPWAKSNDHLQLSVEPLEPEQEPEDTAPTLTKGQQGAKPEPKRQSNAPASKILFLDGLRDLASMLVVAQHSFYMIHHPVGQPAVDTFFVLSAFLLTMIFEKKARTLVREKASYRRWGWALLDYFVRRFLRVYPLFVVVAFALWLLPNDLRQAYFVPWNPENYDFFQTITFDMSQRHHVFWSLPLEIAYYFIIPPFVVLTIALNKYWYVPLVPLSYLVVYSGLYWLRTDHQPLKPHLPTFLCGSMAAILYAKADQWLQTHNFQFRWPHRLLLRTVELVFIGLMVSTVFEGLFEHWWFTNPVPRIAGGGPFISVNIAVLIVSEMLLPGAVSSILEWSLLRFAGKISFSMYLLHSFVVFNPWIQYEAGEDWFFAIWGLTFLVSTASYYVFEYPCQLLAGRVGKAIKARDLQEKLTAPQSLPETPRTPHAADHSV